MTTKTLSNGLTVAITPSKFGGHYVRRVGASALVSSFFAEDGELDATLAWIASK